MKQSILCGEQFDNIIQLLVKIKQIFKLDQYEHESSSISAR